MPHSAARFVCLALVLAAACGSSSDPPPAGCDGPCVVEPDAGPPPVRCDQAGGTCGRGESCFAGECIANACIASPCDPGDACRMECAPLIDPCQFIDCDFGNTCVDGICVPGCFPPSACLNADCPDGQLCWFGACVDHLPCDGDCPGGTVCTTRCFPRSPCQEVD